MDSLIQDLRYSARTLRKSPGFTLVAVLTLGLGIGANTAIFSVVNAVLLRPLPYRDPRRLVLVTERMPQFPQMMVAYADFLDWRAGSRSFEDLAVYNRYRNLSLTGDGEPERIPTAFVTANLFGVLGVRPALGRELRPADDLRGAGKVAVLSDGFWRRRFGADPRIVGREVTYDGERYTIVAVMPRGFAFAAGVEQWVPIGPFIDDNWMSRNQHNGLVAVGRLKPGVTLDGATADLAAVARRLEEAYHATNAKVGVAVHALSELAVGGIRPTLLALVGAVGFILLIACANLAHLTLARASRRRREVAIRGALGASAGRLARQCVTESVVLSLWGGALGLLIAWWGTGLLRTYGAGRVPRAMEIGVDGWVLAFTAGIALLTGLAFGLVPARQAGHSSVHDALKEGARSGDAGPGRARLRAALVAIEVALSFVLVIASGLLVRSIAILQRVNPGFEPSQVLTANIELAPGRYTPSGGAQIFFRQVLDRLRATPGVRYAGATSPMPFGLGGWQTGITVEGMPEPGPGQNPLIDAAKVSGDYFRAMGIPLQEGRFFSNLDDDRTEGVVIVNAAMARRFWPGRSAIGGRIHFGGPGSATPWMTVVGVVGDVKQGALEAEVRPTFYLSYLQQPVNGLTLVLRTTDTPERLVPALREAVRTVDPDQPIFGVETLQGLVADSEATRRFILSLFGLFAGLALVLAAVGTYGVMSSLVAQRTREMGVRIALGAGAPRVLGMVMGQGMGAVALGLVAGTMVALALMRGVAKLLYGVSATDPLTFAAASLLLAGVGALACYLPARRAARVDPVVALRSE